MVAMDKTIDGGLVIIFEGIDGVGKTTQLNLVREELEAEGWAVYGTRNLGGTPIGEELRKTLLSSLERPETTNVYISAAIQEALVAAINGQREAGKIILLDRG